ncbi:hypothetical protein [Dyadobacter sp. NIV53]|uniref:hypothetical protein n=1 Tax=Dyadobacter sp. NIV53 TaxID=2861765 RepID=UPI001E5B595E|nr:hypothetical protein [Dyadobacter sp. NIV53]
MIFKEMKKEKKKRNIQFQAYLSRWCQVCLAVSFFLFCGLKPSLQSQETEPYVLKYPANFGGRFVIPTDNPTTKEGVYLGSLLFYEKNYLPIIHFPVQAAISKTWHLRMEKH